MSALPPKWTWADPIGAITGLMRCSIRRGLFGRAPLNRTQLVEIHRLDIERALVGEPGPKTGLIDQLAEQFEIGIRRQHDVETAIGLKALAGLLEQGRDVTILRARVPAAVGEIAGLASMFGRTR